MADSIEISNVRELPPRHIWKVGDTFQVYPEPTVEGMVAGSHWINEAFMVIFLVPAYTTVDGKNEKAAILLRAPAACLRTKLDAYDFSIPSDPTIKEQVIKANGNYGLLQDVLPLLNQAPVFLPHTPIPQTPLQSPTPLPLVLEQPTEISDQVSVQLALSQAQEVLPQLPSHLQDEEVLNHLARELSTRLTFTKPTSVSSAQPPLRPSLHSGPPISHHHVRKSRSSSSSTSRRTGSFSNSSTSSSSSTSRHRKVRSHRRHKSSGVYPCPFSSTDTRNLTRPSKRPHTRSEERKYLRYALHDIYNDYTTLKNFVDSLRSTLVASPTKPYTSDLIWLQHHADYLDTVLLHNSTGPWATWNETIIDKLTRAFLELVVRVSPRRKYPDLLEEPVRKWMKRKRVGVASQYGPVPPFLSQAKVTDTGIEPKNGWDTWRPKDSTSQSATGGGTKTRPLFPSPGEKK